MAKIVFSEGERDVRFMRKFFERYHDEPRIDQLVIEDVARDELFNRESDKISSFLGSWNDHNLLVKSENGKSNLKSGFSFVIRDLATRPVEKYVLVDLDRRGIDEFVDDVQERIRGRHGGGGLRVDDTERLERCREMVATQVELRNERGRDPRTGFTVLAFREDLETVAGVTDDDGPDEEAEKLMSLLETSSLDRLLQRTLL